jgi:hypothetical protein
MTDHTKAIEAAGKAAYERYNDQDAQPYSEMDADDKAMMLAELRPAIAAFLRTVEASPAMIEAGEDHYLAAPTFKAMSATLADEVEQG